MRIFRRRATGAVAICALFALVTLMAGCAAERLHREGLADVAELFVSGTTSEILPVVAVDGRPVGDGKPGPVTRRLQEAYRRAVQEFVSR